MIRSVAGLSSENIYRLSTVLRTGFSTTVFIFSTELVKHELNYNFFLKKNKIIIFQTPHETTEFALQLLCDISKYVENVSYKEAPSHQVHS